MEAPTQDRQDIFLPAKRGRIAILIVLLGSLSASLWHIHIMNGHFPTSHSDLAPVWSGVRAILHGQNPYSEQATREIQTLYYGRPVVEADHVNKMGFAYPAHTGIVLAPLALLSWNAARIAFLLLMPILTAACIPLWLRTLQIRIPASQVALIALALLASWPVIWGLRLQQATLIVASLLAIGCLLLMRHADGAAGFVLALTTIKPQLVGVLLVWLLLWAALQKRWRFVGSFFAVSAGLLFPSLWIRPDWIGGWIASMVDYAHYTRIYLVLPHLFGPWLGGMLMIGTAVSSGLVLWRARHCSPDCPEFGVAIGLALAAPIALLPSALTLIYNAILLVPAWLGLIPSKPANSIAGLARFLALTVVGWSFFVTALAALGETISPPSSLWEALPFETSLLPIACTLALIATAIPHKVRHPSLEVIPA